MAPMYGPILDLKGMTFIQPPANGHEFTSPKPYSVATSAGWLTVRARRNRQRRRVRGAL